MVQMVAWTKMFAAHVQTMSVQNALVVTLDGSAPCKLCRSVSKAREVARKQAVQTAQNEAKKIVLACELSDAAVTASVARADWPRLQFTVPASRQEQVPVPPPRA
jgi:hypothetical protein